MTDAAVWASTPGRN